MDIKKIYQDSSLHIQTTSYTCGPCALLNILRLKGDNKWTEQMLERLCEAKPGIGTTNEALLVAAAQTGLELISSKTGAEVRDIEEHLDAGRYVIVNYLHGFDGLGHYGVIVEHDELGLYLRDSSLGLVRIKKKDFTKYWYSNDKTIPQWLAVFK